ncbi:MAG: type II toxin-antitoxin system prevent-host-death family antitoxin [Woronichinia naegeliana WA131]|jgi:prevent-host-death family protein|uniref:Type II toxin-antitoxin system prevent-host-death family antitoxin n=1 Tax=Woronichinia naegeliana WA131 TaxID=2824559 RepID=A0A977L0U5_9CYAN|nr:MAG: type II toxin-antitoxin system prevent-host-death family antitoxin [Woronichinia naegeliana WA131]
MKQLTLEQLSEQLQDYVRSTQGEQILITDNGKPIALLLGLENTNLEQLNLQLSAQFWEMISDRRKRPTVPLSVVEKQLENLE